MIGILSQTQLFLCCPPNPWLRFRWECQSRLKNKLINIDTILCIRAKNWRDKCISTCLHLSGFFIICQHTFWLPGENQQNVSATPSGSGLAGSCPKSDCHAQKNIDLLRLIKYSIRATHSTRQREGNWLSCVIIVFCGYGVLKRFALTSFCVWTVLAISSHLLDALINITDTSVYRCQTLVRIIFEFMLRNAWVWHASMSSFMSTSLAIPHASPFSSAVRGRHLPSVIIPVNWFARCTEQWWRYFCTSRTPFDIKIRELIRAKAVYVRKYLKARLFLGAAFSKSVWFNGLYVLVWWKTDRQKEKAPPPITSLAFAFPWINKRI